MVSLQTKFTIRYIHGLYNSLFGPAIVLTFIVISVSWRNNHNITVLLLKSIVFTVCRLFMLATLLPQVDGFVLVAWLWLGLQLKQHLKILIKHDVGLYSNCLFASSFHNVSRLKVLNQIHMKVKDFREQIRAWTVKSSAAMCSEVWGCEGTYVARS